MIRDPNINQKQEFKIIKNGEPIPVNQFSNLMTATGVEPTTAGAEIKQ